MCDSGATPWLRKLDSDRSTVEELEEFRGELVKRVLKWPKNHSNTAAIAILDVPTIKCRVLVWKLGFWKRVMNKDADSLSGRMSFIIVVKL